MEIEEQRRLEQMEKEEIHAKMEQFDQLAERMQALEEREDVMKAALEGYLTLFQ